MFHENIHFFSVCTLYSFLHVSENSLHSLTWELLNHWRFQTKVCSWPCPGAQELPHLRKARLTQVHRGCLCVCVRGEGGGWGGWRRNEYYAWMIYSIAIPFDIKAFPYFLPQVALDLNCTMAEMKSLSAESATHHWDIQLLSKKHRQWSLFIAMIDTYLIIILFYFIFDFFWSVVDVKYYIGFKHRAQLFNSCMPYYSVVSLHNLLQR